MGSIQTHHGRIVRSELRDGEGQPDHFQVGIGSVPDAPPTRNLDDVEEWLTTQREAGRAEPSDLRDRDHFLDCFTKLADIGEASRLVCEIRRMSDHVDWDLALCRQEPQLDWCVPTAVDPLAEDPKANDPLIRLIPQPQFPLPQLITQTHVRLTQLIMQIYVRRYEYEAGLGYDRLHGFDEINNSKKLRHDELVEEVVAEEWHVVFRK